MPLMRLAFCTACLLFVNGTVAQPAQQDEMLEARQATFKQAVQKVTKSIVRIETAGGLEMVGKQLKGVGPTSGLIVGADGWIVSSQFNFANVPSGILVTLPDGKRVPAKLVSTDRSRKVVLLKVAATGLSVPSAVPVDKIRSGQWSLALGKALTPDEASISVGVVSAVGRVWGRAIQSDAKISPVNYGGPLIDIDGKVLGVLVPISPNDSEESAGVEWYDSGIGFAIPLADILEALPRLKKGDLDTGVMGVAFNSQDQYSVKPVLAQIAWGSPAGRAGLKSGDLITHVDGTPVDRQSQIKHLLGRKYGGDKVSITAMRGDKKIDVTFELTAKLPHYARTYLGIAPAPKKDAKGLVVSAVVPRSPAEHAGVVAGDVITALDQEPITSVDSLEAQLDSRLPGQLTTIKFKHGEKAMEKAVRIAMYPGLAPNELKSPALKTGAPASAITAKPLGDSHKNCWLMTKEGSSDSQSHGLIVWLVDAEGPKRQKLEELFKSILPTWNTSLLIMEPSEAAGWNPKELGKMKNAVEAAIARTNTIASRVCVVAFGKSASFAEQFHSSNRRMIRGIAQWSGGEGKFPPPAPSEKLSLLAIWSQDEPTASLFSSRAELLKNAKHVVGLLPSTAARGVLTAHLAEDLCRWNWLLGTM